MSETQVAETLRKGNLLTCVGLDKYQTLPMSLGPRLVVFTANSDGSATSTWCPDCRRAMPVVLSSALDSGLPLTVVGVGEKADWKVDQRGKDHPFRAKDGLALTGVPTMLLIGKDGGEIGRLGSELENEQDQGLMKKLLDNSLRQLNGSQHYFINGTPANNKLGQSLHSSSAGATNEAACNFDPTALKSVLASAEGRCIRIFVAGAVTHVGKTTVCLSILCALRKAGLQATDIAYIKPATQCEAPDLLQKWCETEGVEHVSGESAPLVFKSGFTRSFLDGEQGTSAYWIERIKSRVDELAATRRVLIVDGVGFPAVGSIVGVDNADVAKAVSAPVIIICKAGVGGAIDSFSLNSTYFLAKGVPVLGAVFNLAETEGFYSWDKCAPSLQQWFAGPGNRREKMYGIVPKAQCLDGLRERIDKTEAAMLLEFADVNAAHFLNYVDITEIIRNAALDPWNQRRTSPSKRPAPVSLTSGTASKFKPLSEVVASAEAAGAKGGG